MVLSYLAVERLKRKRLFDFQKSPIILEQKNLYRKIGGLQMSYGTIMQEMHNVHCI